jgi:hypothetical protein
MHIFVADCEKRELIFAFHGEISSILLSFHDRSRSSKTAELICALRREKEPKAPPYIAYLVRLHERTAPRDGWDSVVGIATCYGLDGPGFESRWRWDFQSRPDRSRGRPAPCTMGTGYFPGVKRPDHGPEHSPLSSAELRIVWSYISASRLCLHRNVLWWLYLYLWSHLGPAVFFAFLKRCCRSLASANSLHFPSRLTEHYLQISDMFFQISLEVWSEYTLKSILSLDTRSWKMLSNFTP